MKHSSPEGEIVESPKRQAGICCLLMLAEVVYVECHERFSLIPERLELLKTKRYEGIIVMVVTKEKSTQLYAYAKIN